MPESPFLQSLINRKSRFFSVLLNDTNTVDVKFFSLTWINQRIAKIILSYKWTDFTQYMSYWITFFPSVWNGRSKMPVEWDCPYYYLLHEYLLHILIVNRILRH